MREFRQCPSCGYERGFHVSFKDAENGMAISLICPNCGQSYDVGWNTQEIKKLSPKKGSKYKSMS